jgi:hypothetical protein
MVHVGGGHRELGGGQKRRGAWGIKACFAKHGVSSSTIGHNYDPKSQNTHICEFCGLGLCLWK